MYQHQTVTVLTKPLGMRIPNGSLQVDAVKGQASKLGIMIGDELVRINDTNITPGNWKDYYMAANCPFRMTLLRKTVQTKAVVASTAEGDEKLTVVKAILSDDDGEGGGSTGHNGTGNNDHNNSQNGNSNAPADVTYAPKPASLPSRYNVITRTVTVKPYGMSVASGTVKVKEVKGAALEDGVRVGDEIISIAGVRVEAMDWKEIFRSAACPFPITYIVDNPEASAAEQLSFFNELDAPEGSFGIGLGEGDFNALKAKAQETTDDPAMKDALKTVALPKSLDPLLSILREGWGAFKDVRALCAGLGKAALIDEKKTREGDTQTDETMQRMSSLIERIRKLTATTSAFINSTAFPGGGQAREGGQNIPLFGNFSTKGESLQWTPGASLTELVQKLAESISTMQGKTTNITYTVDEVLAKIQDSKERLKAGAAAMMGKGHDQDLTLLLTAQEQLANQLQYLNQVRHVIITLKEDLLSKQEDTKGDPNSLKQLMAESIHVLQDRTKSLASQIKAVGKELKESITFMRSVPSDVDADSAATPTGTPRRPTDTKDASGGELESSTSTELKVTVKEKTTTLKDDDKDKKKVSLRRPSVRASFTVGMAKEETGPPAPYRSNSIDLKDIKNISLKSVAFIKENQPLIEGGLSLLTLIGVVKPKQALVIQKTMALTSNNSLDSKEKIVTMVFESLLKTLPHIKIPDIEGTSTDKAYWFQVGNLTLADLKVRRDQVRALMRDGGRLTVQISDLEVTMRQVTWAFRQLSWPRLKAKGKADTRASGISLRLILQLHKTTTKDSFGKKTEKWAFRLARKTVSIEKLKMRITSSSVSWVANTILWLFSEATRKYVCAEIEQTITEKMGGLIDVLNKMIRVPYVQRTMDLCSARYTERKPKASTFAVANESL